MARWSTTAVIRIGTVALFACFVQVGAAQRGGGHGGFAAHGAPHVSSGGFRASAPSRSMGRPFAPSRAGFPGRSFGSQRPFAASGRLDRGRAPYDAARYARSSEYRPDPYRRPYRERHRQPYLNAAWSVWPGWTVPYYIGYPDDYGYDYDGDQETQAQPDQEDTYAGEPYASQPEPWPAYPPVEPAASQPTPAAAQQEPVTLIFKDARQPVQVRNYMMTSNTLYVLDQKRREIPLKDLDLAATARANRDAGVDFKPPAGTP